jgi:hypothetical protein
MQYLAPTVSALPNELQGLFFSWRHSDSGNRNAVCGCAGIPLFYLAGDERKGHHAAQVWACVGRVRQGVFARGLDACVSARSVAASCKPRALVARV